MSRSSKLVRRVLPALVAAVALSLVAGACDWAQPPAVSGKGFDVSGSSFADLIKVTDKDKAIDQNSGKASGKRLPDPTPTVIADMLTLRINYQLFINEAARRHLTIQQQAIDTAKTQIASASEASSWPKAFQAWLARGVAAQTLVYADINKDTGAAREAAERALYEQVKNQNSQTCVEFVATASQSAANTAASGVKGGKSFGDALTAAKAADPQAEGSGATPQCLTDISLQSVSPEVGDAITKAALNDVVGPVAVQNADPNTGATSSAFFVLRVVSRGAPTFEQMQPQLDQQYAQQVALQLRSKVLPAAHISVDPRYGTWDSKSFSVTGPQGPTSKQLSDLNINNPTGAGAGQTTDLSGLTGAGSGTSGTPGG